MSIKEKGHHPPNRRLAAVSFLNSISLNGSYRDGCWSLESDKLEQGLIVPSVTSLNSTEVESQRIGNREPHHRVHSEKHRNSSTTPGENQPVNRTRSNTGSFGRPDGYTHQPKHAHFSSSESLDHGNGSDFSVHYEKTTMVNMTTDSLPSIKNERLVILVSHRSPLVVFSSLPYSRDNRTSKTMDRPELIRRTRNASGSRPISTLSDPDPLEQLVQFQEEEVSYGYLLQPTKAFHRVDHHVHGGPVMGGDETDHHLIPPAVSSSCHAQDGLPNGTRNPETVSLPEASETHGIVSMHKSTVSAYSPHLLDDPEFRAGKHRTLLTFPSYITSVIDYCKASDMKKELNDKFKDRFPHIHLTLSKLRSLKREMRRVAKAECNVDLLTVAQAYVYFEKLILGSFVTKYNRKFCAGACLLLSAKLNDVKGYHLHNLFDMIEKTFRVNRKELLNFEFGVLVALEFTLHLPTWEVFPHYQRLLYES